MSRHYFRSHDRWLATFVFVSVVLAPYAMVVLSSLRGVQVYWP